MADIFMALSLEGLLYIEGGAAASRLKTPSSSDPRSRSLPRLNAVICGLSTSHPERCATGRLKLPRT
jgi:hypothetical protein